MDWQKLLNEPPPSKSKYLTWIIVVGGLMLAAPPLWLWRRKRKHAVAELLLLLGFVAAPAARAADLDKAGNWTVSHGSGESMRISQCGLNVAIFTLEYFRAPYQVKRVAAGLPPNEDGIRFSDIKTMLECHGLDVVARERVTLEGLKRVLKQGTLAIFPIRISERENHYLIALRHDSRGPMLIDPPTTARLLEEAVTEDHLAALGGVVLFVRKPKDSAPKQNSRVKIEPESIDLGSFRDDDPTTSKLIRKHIGITNVSEKPVLISDVFTACGCLNTKWKGGVLAAGESCNVPADIALGGWVPGRKSQRDLTLAFADGSVRRIGFIADMISVIRPRHLQLHPDFVCINLAVEPTAAERQVRVELGDSKSKHLSVSSHPPWLQVDLKPEAEGTARLVLRLLPKAIPPQDRVTGEICLACSSAEPVAKLPVIVNRQPLYRLEPPIVHFPSNATQERVVLLAPCKRTLRLQRACPYFRHPKACELPDPIRPTEQYNCACPSAHHYP